MTVRMQACRAVGDMVYRLPLSKKKVKGEKYTAEVNAADVALIIRHALELSSLTTEDTAHFPVETVAATLHHVGVVADTSEHIIGVSLSDEDCIIVVQLGIRTWSSYPNDPLCVEVATEMLVTLVSFGTGQGASAFLTRCHNWMKLFCDVNGNVGGGRSELSIVLIPAFVKVLRQICINQYPSSIALHLSRTAFNSLLEVTSACSQYCATMNQRLNLSSTQDNTNNYYNENTIENHIARKEFDWLILSESIQVLRSIFSHRWTSEKLNANESCLLSSIVPEESLPQVYRSLINVVSIALRHSPPDVIQNALGLSVHVLVTCGQLPEANELALSLLRLIVEMICRDDMESMVKQCAVWTIVHLLARESNRFSILLNQISAESAHLSKGSVFECLMMTWMEMHSILLQRGSIYNRSISIIGLLQLVKVMSLSSNNNSRTAYLLRAALAMLPLVLEDNEVIVCYAFYILIYNRII